MYNVKMLIKFFLKKQQPKKRLLGTRGVALFAKRVGSYRGQTTVTPLTVRNN